MKKLIFTLAFLLSGCLTYVRAEGAYVEAGTNVLNESYGFRFGRSVIVESLDSKSWDFSGGYFKDVENKVDLHTISLEMYRNIAVPYVLLKVGGGIGYTIPNYDSGPSKGDNGHSWILGGAAEYKISDHVSVLGSVKGFFFTTDTHQTWHTSHLETLSNGQEVEIDDEHHSDDSSNFDKVLLGVNVRYAF